MEDFVGLFKFDPTNALCVGVERERFLVNDSGFPVPKSESVLEILPNDGAFGYELSACQLEDRVGPIPLSQLVMGLEINDLKITKALNKLKVNEAFYEVAQEDMDLSVYNDPTGRYQQIVKNMPKEILLAACRVAGTHVHVGMPDMESALKVYNEVIKHWKDLCTYIDNSNGERLQIYQQMAPGYCPKPYSSVEQFYDDALLQGFNEDPRKNWQLIRITIHGTIEFRMGGATSSHEKVFAFAKACHSLCSAVLFKQ